MRCCAKTTLALATLIAAACGSRDDATTPNGSGADVVVADDIRYEAGTAVLESFPVQLVTTVRVRALERPRELTISSGCEVFLLVYAHERLVWDQRRAVMCTMMLQMLTVPTDSALTLETRTDAAEILGDSLPDGRYELVALVNSSAGGVRVPAGRADLAVPR